MRQWSDRRHEGVKMDAAIMTAAIVAAMRDVWSALILVFMCMMFDVFDVACKAQS